MTEPWRRCCARCGSRSVRRKIVTLGWECKVCGPTPAVYDLKEETWKHIESQRNDLGTPPGAF